MIRKALLEKVSSIEPTTSVIYTYDMGVGFALITRDGMHEEMGGNYSEWPLYRFPAPSHNDRGRILKAIEAGSFDLDVLRETDLRKLGCLIEEYNHSVELNERIQATDFANSLRVALLRAEGSIYVYCVLEPWHHEIALFATSKEIETEFIGRYELTPWERLEDEDLERYLDDIESPGFVFRTPCDD
jgi:hypothetical protein